MLILPIHQHSNTEFKEKIILTISHHYIAEVNTTYNYLHLIDFISTGDVYVRRYQMTSTTMGSLHVVMANTAIFKQSTMTFY